ncbi:MAG TPA: hypothetical protein VK656_06505 [Candidatus Acidoferrum sp.]|nr:hypothetical protein [Candidatus Acidoferrum sp.]
MTAGPLSGAAATDGSAGASGPAASGPAASGQAAVPSAPLRRGWLGAVGRAADLSFGRPSLWPIALAGFLARGGFVLLLIPIFPIPTAVGLANILGPTAVTAAGLSADSVVLLVVIGLATVAWYLAAGLVGAAADIALVDATRDDDADSGRSGPAGVDASSGTGGLIVRLIAIRFISLIPLAVAIALTARPIFDALYGQLTAPSQVAEPLAIRVFLGATGSFVVVVVGWFIGEISGGIAVRYAILQDLSIGRSVVRAITHLVRRPLTTALTAIAGTAGIVVTLGPSLVASAVAWNRLHGFVADQSDLTFVVVSAVIAGSWLAALVFAALGSAWRGLLLSADVGRAVDSSHRT